MLRKRTRPADPQSGQAMVEAALTLPLTVFLILGTLQFFLLLQARLLTEYAAFRAVRTGSVKHGDCEAMTHAAIAALLPAFTRTDSARRLGEAFYAHKDNLYQPQKDSGHSGAIVWISRERPLRAELREDEEESFDDPARYTRMADVVRLEARLIFWFPMRIPFANWVLGRMILADMGLRNYNHVNPLMPTQVAQWTRQTAFSLEEALGAEMLQRADRKEYVFPLQANYSMRMMTPPRPQHFQTQNCAPAPGTP
ncbi:TadE/TadG family type IV pilus assembly protein [Stigmatella aurantiaca]|uniref:TadE-like pilus biogenesis protein n=2 Tax=Stigmatella aurantiaca (strain DW4/3-1) TaxID=378806 RepID=E3FEN7_STIAD|nr:TadE family protein [Stigmatella aurantiaca]ADO68868.1 TadE-like pilus biogenesis protein [Stigmatella aurantiaca DW4/3-1]